ncbi:HAD-IA family hydrolase [Nocardia xishanensis]
MLVDFAGVMTTSVLAGFRAFGAKIGVDPGLPIRLFTLDPRVRTARAELESGVRADEEFEAVLAAALTEHGGGGVEPEGLLRRIRSELEPDREMIALIAGLKAAGHPVALVSNSLALGRYDDDVDLTELVDASVVSAEVGARKPSRAFYELACERLEIEPHEAVMIDDLPHNIEGAKRVGIDGIVHGSAGTTAEELATRFGVFPLLPPTPPATDWFWRRRRSYR